MNRGYELIQIMSFTHLLYLLCKIFIFQCEYAQIDDFIMFQHLWILQGFKQHNMQVIL